MCGNGWGLSPWGTAPWALDVGWGTGEWGVIPWGGCPGEPGPTPPTPSPPLGLRPGWRYERIRRHREQREEPELVRNVIFAVEGLRAKAKHGKARIYAGTGIALRLRRLPPAHASLGDVRAGAASVATVPHAEIAYAELGDVEVSASCLVHLEEAPATKATVGEASLRTQRNPTDEEILMMIAEVV